MKFCKKYEEYMQTQDQKKLPGVGFKNLKKILKRCRRDMNHSRSSLQSQSSLLLNDSSDNTSALCLHPCPVCDGYFFPSLMKEMSMVVGCFNKRAQKVLDVHLATGFRKYFVWCRDKFQGKHGALIQEGENLVGQAFRSQVKSMHMEILQSPWLCELIAFHINLSETKADMRKGSELFEGCSLIFSDGKPSLSCELSDTVKLEIDLTCSVCLDTVFDPVYLTCGHIFCFMCACKSGSVTIVDGLKATKPTAKCPLCREVWTFSVPSFFKLSIINICCPEYWEERLRTERAERIRQTKEHWQSQSRAFLGI
ncbi:Zinc finger, RING/FYVE/PHD-type [Cynara cardunculus var. scolymus]|uniref:Zinc finger, RING/FYVE/PHD-type n=1 Tax=Cynara cardunculus var. scolymus TaxID=59895 RepID=A0A118JWH8_CYNCS|nr:Zinc finger, RING/FYVE/PHD-type [Cynara cardunculus var. scolymus]